MFLSSTRGCGLPCVLLLLLTLRVVAAAVPEPVVVQARGVDPRVDYAALGDLGPWDDRNYAITREQLALLPPREADLRDPIPAFFRIELREQLPHLRREGVAQYPRAAVPLFHHRYGGILRDGRILDAHRGADGALQVDAEIDLSALAGANEVTVEINAALPLQAVAGANASGGQEMYYSGDGGRVWRSAGLLPNACCDPTVDWSADGTIAYAASLSGQLGVSVWRSTDGGRTWGGRVDVTGGGSDKEWLHVDKSAQSPWRERVYLTYHDANVMQVARSSDRAVSFDVTAFPEAPSGIGSDITTDSAGNVYNFYGAIGERNITLLKSTDGGESWEEPQEVARTNASFDFAIPAMETRGAWIYASAATDLSGGVYHDSIYVAWTDTTGFDTIIDPYLNHSVINVAYSRDGGATWSVTHPHSLADSEEVDRFNQWLTVGDDGVVHVVFYDTRNSDDRTGTDLYYTYSTDGAASWSEPKRVTTATSANLGDLQEWGDYNGVAVVGETLIPTWTDNRDGTKDVYAADTANPVEPGFVLVAEPDALEVCVPDTVAVDLRLGRVAGFASAVTLEFADLPAGFGAEFTVNPVVPASPPAQTTALLAIGETAAGAYPLRLDAVSGAPAASAAVDLGVVAFRDVPRVGPLPLSPVNGSILTTERSPLTWAERADAASYTVTLATDPWLLDVVFQATLRGTSVTPDVRLAPQTQYFWRVRAANACGAGVSSPLRTFTTGPSLCSTNGAIEIPDDGEVADTLAVAAGGSILDLDVSVRATHGHVGDLDLTLLHVDSNRRAVIIDRPGFVGFGSGCSGNDVDVVLDDEAPAPVEEACSTGPALGGTLAPNNALGVFDGDDIGGTWRLTVRDNASPDAGTLQEWCLLATLPSPGADSDGDGVEDGADNCTLLANADQLDADGDLIGNRCDADIAEPNDCIVDFADLAVFQAAFFGVPGSPGWNASADMTGDGRIDFADLALVKEAFFGAPGPSAGGCN